jgi:hypothetical protein
MNDLPPGDDKASCSPVCPHCSSLLKKWATPADSSWGGGFLFVCFNDECPYYVRGWERMKEKYNATVSYRYRCDPTTGETGPLPVWSEDALKGQILES